MPFFDRISAVLSHPRAYLVGQFLVGGINARKIVIRDYVKPRSGLRVLDIGCGPAYTVAYFPRPEYYGFDVSSRYIAFANRRHQSYGRFFAQVFDEAALAWVPRVDVVLMLGLLHHLDDQSTCGLLDLARRAMTHDGRLFTVDGCFAPGQSRVARYLLERDRGKFVRDQEGYIRLATEIFQHVSAAVRTDLFHVPYSALILECRP